MRTEPIDKWVRAYVGDVAVVDTRTPLLFWEDDFPVPAYAFDETDVRTDLLRPTEAPAPGAWSFFDPQGPVSQWYDVVVGERRCAHAAWRRDEPAIADRLVLSWRPGLLDRWTEEDEEVGGHPKDPYHRVEVLPSSRHVVVRRDGVLLAESRRPVLLYETMLPIRYYLPEEDVVADALVPEQTRTHCPYKGYAERYWGLRHDPEVSGIAWCYDDPKPAVAQIAGRITFYNELVDLEVDGRPLPRAQSPFSEARHRSGD
jgi:uncharacterized protein (DUF427 family)